VTIPVVAFFSNKGGVGRTTLVYHISWMMANMGHRVVVADLDPQSSLTEGLLSEQRREALLPNDRDSLTISGALRPLQRGNGDIGDPHIELIDENLGLLPGDMELSGFEEQISEAWATCQAGDARAFAILSALWRILQRAAQNHDASLVVLDLGPSMSSLNRAALIASDFVVIPIKPALYSLQGLRILGSQLRTWREGWSERRCKSSISDLQLPIGRIEPLGYVVMQDPVRLDRPLESYQRWLARIPGDYRTYVLGTQNSQVSPGRDPNCIAAIRYYTSLMAMAHEARKPVFHLKPADGAQGSHAAAVRDAYRDFKAITEEILARVQGRQTPVAPPTG
jgi:chromosome partitioning protein